MLLLGGAHPSQRGGSAAPKDVQTQDASEGGANGPATHPFVLVRDQSGLLSTLLGALEHVHSHPMQPVVREHVRGVLGRMSGRGSGPTNQPQVHSKHLLNAHTGVVAQSIRQNMSAAAAQRAGEESLPLLGWEVDMVRKSLTMGHMVRKDRFNRLSRLREEWQHRDRYTFGNWTQNFTAKRDQQAVKFEGKKHASLVQLPSYLVPPRVYHGLLQYYARTNNFAAALNTYDRMRHNWVSPSFAASLALVDLAVKYMNYDALAHLMRTEALPLSHKSPARRARLWKVLIKGFAKYNSYSNVDTYMRYLLQLLTPQSNTGHHVNQLIASHTGGQSASSSSPPPPAPRTRLPSDAPSRENPIHKRQLDDLWGAWVSRGGANEVLGLWDALRASNSSAQQPTLDVGVNEILDDASIDSFLSGALHRVQAGEVAVGGLSALAAVDAVSALLRYVTRHGLALSSTHVRRIAVDLPLLIAEARRSQSSSADAALAPVARGASEQGLRALLRDNFTSDHTWHAFCDQFNVPDSMRAATEGDDQLSALEQRVRLYEAAWPRSESSKPQTRSEVRAAVLGLMLRSLSTPAGANSVDHAIERLTLASTQQA